MTDLELARECGAKIDLASVVLSHQQFRALAARIRQEEREAAAAICEGEVVEISTDERGAEADVSYNLAIEHCAAAIRARRGESQ